MKHKDLLTFSKVFCVWAFSKARRYLQPEAFPKQSRRFAINVLSHRLRKIFEDYPCWQVLWPDNNANVCSHQAAFPWLPTFCQPVRGPHLVPYILIDLALLPPAVHIWKHMDISHLRHMAILFLRVAPINYNPHFFEAFNVTAFGSGTTLLVAFSKACSSFLPCSGTTTFSTKGAGVNVAPFGSGAVLLDAFSKPSPATQRPFPKPSLTCCYCLAAQRPFPKPSLHCLRPAHPSPDLRGRFLLKTATSRILFTTGVRFRQVHNDHTSTVHARVKDGNPTQGQHRSRDRPGSTLRLRSRSRSKHSRRRSFPPKPPLLRSRDIHLHSRTLPATAPALTTTSHREQSQSEAESAQVDILPPVEFDLPDWSRPSQEREIPAEEETSADEMMAIPKTQSLNEDWKRSVQKAFDDPTRTKAPCETPGANSLALVQRVSKRQYDSFIQILRSKNPTAPEEVIGNMASIFAQSGKMSNAQAEDSYTFKVPNALGYALFVPTHFGMRAPFQNNDSNVYHILHGATNKGASLILAEELIRPGDFTMHKDLAKCGYPSYGFYSAGEVAAKTRQFSHSLKELSRKILKIGKGSLPVFIGGIYTGRNPHINQMSGGNEEIQRLCGEHGVARGKEKYTVARSEHTTVCGVMLTYMNAIDAPGPTVGPR